MEPWAIALTLLAVGVSFTVSASAGLGGSLILVPTLALILGAKEGVAHLSLAFLNHDDIGLIPNPAYPVHYNGVIMAGGILYNIPPSTTSLPPGVSRADLPPGTREGLNDWKRTGYGGPCPPIGRHRYFHKLYVLDVQLPDLGTPTKAALEEAMADHILASAELVGTYERAS